MGETTDPDTDAPQCGEAETEAEIEAETEAEMEAEAEGDAGAGGAGASVRACEVLRAGGNGAWGFHLSRTQWDPYPWVSGVDGGSAADAAGLLPGDCVLEVNGEDVLGERIGAVAARVRARPDKVSLLLWNAGSDPACDPESLCCAPMPLSLTRLSACVAAVLAALECPVCLELVSPPAHQCANGHLICVRCRVRAERCPVCRVRFTRGRSLLADHCFQALTDAFNLKSEPAEARPAKMRERLFGHRKKSAGKRSPPPSPRQAPTPSPTNKFLARLMGKALSVENLSSAGREGKGGKGGGVGAAAGADGGAGFAALKAKSLSSSEIFRPLSPAPSRCPSPQPSHPASPALAAPALLAAPGLGLQRARSRPASFHGSCDSLSGRIAAEFGHREAAHRLTSASTKLYNGTSKESKEGDEDDQEEDDLDVSEESELCHCPASASCHQLLPSGAILRHIQHQHTGPLVCFGEPRALWSLPPPLEGSALLSFRTPELPSAPLERATLFIVVERDAELDSADIGGSGEGDGDSGWRLWAWGAGEGLEAVCARATVRGGAREASWPLPVLPLATAAWAEARRVALRLPAALLRERFPAPAGHACPLGLLLEAFAAPPAPPAPALAPHIQVLPASDDNDDN